MTSDEDIVIALNRIATAIERQPVVIHIPRFLTLEDRDKIKQHVWQQIGSNRPVIIISKHDWCEEETPKPTSSVNGFA